MGPLLWAGGAAVPHDLVLGAQHGLDKTSTVGALAPSSGPAARAVRGNAPYAGARGSWKGWWSRCSRYSGLKPPFTCKRCPPSKNAVLAPPCSVGSPLAH